MTKLTTQDLVVHSASDGHRFVHYDGSEDLVSPNLHPDRQIRNVYRTDQVRGLDRPVASFVTWRVDQPPPVSVLQEQMWEGPYGHPQREDGPLLLLESVWVEPAYRGGAALRVIADEIAKDVDGERLPIYARTRHPLSHPNGDKFMRTIAAEWMSRRRLRRESPTRR